MTDDEPIILDAVLKPSPPMTPRALLVILGVVAAINLCFAGYFVARGAWPVSPFMGADVLLLAWAFRASRIAAQREEQITLTLAMLRVARRPGQPTKKPSEFTFNPYWVRVVMDRPEPLEDGPIENSIADHALELTLWSHGRFLRIGSFLAPGERARFGHRLASALNTVKAARFGS